MYLYVFVLYFFVFFYVFCMYRLYLAECVCIDAPSNFSCRKYRQIHAIQTNTRIIHTPIFPKYIQKYIKNKSVTMCMYVHVFACICLYLVCIFCMSVFFASKDMHVVCVCICMYLYVSGDCHCSPVGICVQLGNFEHHVLQSEREGTI